MFATTIVGSATVELNFNFISTRVGFDVGSNIPFNVTISTLLNGNVTGSFAFSQSHNVFAFTPVFRGFEDLSGIDAVRFNFSSGQHFIDNIRFENTLQPIPEPTTIALFGLGGLIMLGLIGKRGRA